MRSASVHVCLWATFSTRTAKPRRAGGNISGIGGIRGAEGGDARPFKACDGRPHHKLRRAALRLPLDGWAHRSPVSHQRVQHVLGQRDAELGQRPRQHRRLLHAQLVHTCRAAWAHATSGRKCVCVGGGEESSYAMVVVAQRSRQKLQNKDRSNLCSLRTELWLWRCGIDENACSA